MKISILLPYKENFSPEYPGAVSIFLNSVIKKSKYKNFITVYGNTEYKKKYKIRYKNIDLSKKLLGFGSQTSAYIRNFVRIENKRPSDIIEIHNRPAYVQLLPENKSKIILYFHNDPLTMKGSKTINDRIFLINHIDKILFNSKWSQNIFFIVLQNIDQLKKKTFVSYQST